MIVHALLVIIVFSALVSCNSSRYSGGFSYKAKDPGMDIGSSGYVVPGTNNDQARQENNMSNSSDPISSVEFPAEENISLSNTEKDKFSEARKMVIEEYQKQIAERQGNMNPAPIKSSEVIAHVAVQMEQKGMIKEVSEKKMRKIEKMADKWDRKVQKRQHDGFLGEGIDLFLAIMAIAGLAVALIFGTFVGVLIFLVFGGIWLYRKLVV